MKHIEMSDLFFLCTMKCKLNAYYAAAVSQAVSLMKRDWFRI